MIEAGLRIIRVTFPCYWLYVFLEVHADALRGCGRSVLPMAVIMTCLCALRTGAAGRLYECLGDAGGGGRRLSMRLAGSGSVSDGVLETVCGKTD